MQTKNLLWITAALLLFTACGKKYTVTAECDASSNGKQAYIIDYTTEKPLDSTIVSDNKAIFGGQTLSILRQLTQSRKCHFHSRKRKYRH